jgi:WD40 repeat protein
MPSIDERLIDPPLQEVAKTLFKAMRSANGRLTERRLDKDLFFFHQFVRRAVRSPGGHKVWTGGRGGMPAAQVKAAWWTDPIGQRHWRVIGRRLDHTSRHPTSPSFALYDPWALWHVYPERLALRRTGESQELIALCRCGVCGTPMSIAWAGECCGPCHDREQEEGLVADGPELAVGLREHTAIVRLLAFHEDRLVSGGADGRIILWDLAKGEKQVLLHRPRTSPYMLNVSSAGMVAVLLGSFHLLLRDLDGRQWEEHALPESCLHGSFSPDGRWLALPLTRSVELFDMASERSRHTIPTERDFRWVLFSADSRTLYGTDREGGLHRMEVPSGEVRALPPPPGMYQTAQYDPYDEDYRPFPFLWPVACSADGKWLAVGAEGTSLLCHLPTEQWSELPALPRTFTSDGRLVLLGGDGGLRLWDPVRQQLSGAFFLPPNLQLGYFAFSPEGERVAGTDVDGRIRVWPWRRMLEGR